MPVIDLQSADAIGDAKSCHESPAVNSLIEMVCGLDNQHVVYHGSKESAGAQMGHRGPSKTT